MKQEEEREKKKAVAHSVLKVDKVAFSLKIMNRKYSEKNDMVTPWPLLTRQTLMILPP